LSRIRAERLRGFGILFRSLIFPTEEKQGRRLFWLPFKREVSAEDSNGIRVIPLLVVRQSKIEICAGKAGIGGNRFLVIGDRAGSSTAGRGRLLRGRCAQPSAEKQKQGARGGPRL